MPPCDEVILGTVLSTSSILASGFAVCLAEDWLHEAIRKNSTGGWWTSGSDGSAAIGLSQDWRLHERALSKGMLNGILVLPPFHRALRRLRFALR